MHPGVKEDLIIAGVMIVFGSLSIATSEPKRASADSPVVVDTIVEHTHEDMNIGVNGWHLEEDGGRLYVWSPDGIGPYRVPPTIDPPSMCVDPNQ